MAAEKASAIVLRSVDFSESSSVVAMFTREFGRIDALAKGARRIKGPFDSALDLLTRCRIVFLRKSSGGLDLLTEAKLERRFRPPGRNAAPLYAGYYVAELLLKLTHQHDPHPELFDSADETLVALALGDDVARHVLRFELMALQVLGHSPNLETCVECGVPIVATERVAFGPLAGGVMCRACRPGKRQVVSISAGVLETLRIFADGNDAGWRNRPIEATGGRDIRGEIRGVVNHYVSHLLGHKPKMHNFLGFLADASLRDEIK